MSRRTILILSILFFALAGQAQMAFAAVSISEIMYKPNPNSNHEWIEIQNISSDAIDFSYTTSKHWKISQNTSDGGIKPYQGGSSLPAGGFAVLAVNPDYFLSDHPGWSGILFDITSLTSLNDTGATLTLTDVSGTMQDTVSYSNTMGASGDGNSLQKIGGAWSAAIPTPGVANESNTATPIQEVTTTQDTTTTTTAPDSSADAVGTYSSFPVDPQIFADAGAPTRTVSVGGEVTFSGRVWGLEKEPIENAKMEWSFGDGARADGVSVSHVYYYPGEYTVVLDASSGYYSASDRVHVVATAPLVSLQTGGDGTRSFISVNNLGSDELDLSGWQIVAQGKTFALPKSTLISPHKTLTVASEVSGLSTSSSTVALLHFPNGALVPLVSSIATEAKTETAAPIVATKIDAPIAPPVPKKVSTPHASAQTASTLAAVDDSGGDSSVLPEQQQESSTWMWYVGVGLLGTLAALGLRLGRGSTKTEGVTADDFEIIEEKDGDS